jgi:16S rRNA (cytosine967-C5)-methyltransferase
VYDAAAAPGGKSLALDAAGARVLAGDVSLARARRVAENLARAGSGHAWPVAADALHPPLREARAVLLDAPCLGTGTLARHPDARWRVTPEALAALARRQARLLDALAGLIPPGGWLTYATCSLEPEENACQVKSFLDGHPSFRRDPPAHLPPELMSPEGDLEILPQMHGMDGAWATRLIRLA